MAGFELKQGQFNTSPVTDDELWSAISYVFSSKSVNDTSYKFGFLKCIIDNLYNVDDNLELTFDQLFSKFAEIYWNLVLKYGLNQKKPTKNGRISSLERELRNAAEKFNILEPIPFESLTEAQMAYITRKVKAKCKLNVVGALFEDTKQLFYSFDRKEEWLRINPKMYYFVCKHKSIIEKLNYYEWARFLEKVNDEDVTLNLLTKIDESSKRSNLSVYRQILFDEFEMDTCFYCGKKVSKENVHVDHFIPWSFIKDDNLWNLVLACPKCNLKKNDKMPEKQYLDALIKRNEQVLVEHSQVDMGQYEKRKLFYIYELAKLNGFDRMWKADSKGN